MFRESQLAALQRHKERLVAQSDAHRRQLIADWRRVESPELWRAEVGEWLRRHPVWLAALAAATGLLTARMFRRPPSLTTRLGRWTKLVSLAFSVWKWVTRKKARP